MKWNDYLIFLAMRMRKRHLFCTSMKHTVWKIRAQQGVWALEWMSLLERVRNYQICSTLVHTWAYHMEKISRRLFYILVLCTSRAEWMNGICLLWSRGRLISPSLPVGDDRYLNLSSQKRNRFIRRSGTTYRRTVVLVFCLRMRRFPLTSSYHIRENEMMK